VLAAEANGRARLVVNVDNLMPYTTKVDGNDIIVTLGQQPGAEVGKMAAAAARAAANPSNPAERAIRTIDFRRGSDGTGRVIVQLTDPRTPVNVRQEGQQIVVDFAGTAMPKNLMRRYDVMDFATPVQTVDAIRVEGSSRLVISSQGDFEQLAYQSDNQYTVEIKASSKRTAGAEEKKEYTGERLTLNFQDIDVRSVLQLLADTSGQNIVVSDSVAGNLTLRLQNVPGIRRWTSCCAPRVWTSAARTTSSSSGRRKNWPRVKRRNSRRTKRCRNSRRPTRNSCRSITPRLLTWRN